ncbi:hypothetical protein CYMTET_43671 [Cymbomonas tetramitiformis]|uniref:Uncharacterized protein n=1 Tax=Cymbomonas tetramitiformis TaxID=36881 RepID=A0AAE0C1S2_9CHLO|nr:hypothetical protein CYMTET_43671 [Cymbomonas tetramitiformis]
MLNPPSAVEATRDSPLYFVSTADGTNPPTVPTDDASQTRPGPFPPATCAQFYDQRSTADQRERLTLEVEKLLTLYFLMNRTFWDRPSSTCSNNVLVRRGWVPAGWLEDFWLYCRNNHPVLCAFLAHEQNPLTRRKALVLELFALSFVTPFNAQLRANLGNKDVDELDAYLVNALRKYLFTTLLAQCLLLLSAIAASVMDLWTEEMGRGVLMDRHPGLCNISLVPHRGAHSAKSGIIVSAAHRTRTVLFLVVSV